MDSLADFIENGKIGNLFLGISRDQTLETLGLPQDWLGKKNIIGPTNERYNDSNLWFFYGGSVGVMFGSHGKSVEIILYSDKAVECPELFQEWPKMNPLTMGRWRDALVARNVVFYEGPQQDALYWIVAADTCVAFGFPDHQDGTPIPWHDRQVPSICKFSCITQMKSQCGFLPGGTRLEDRYPGIFDGLP